MKLYLDKRALLGLIVALIILILLGYFSYRNNNQFIASTNLSFQATEVLNYIEQTQTNSARIEEVLAKYMLSGDTTLLTLYNAEITKASGHFNSLLELTEDNPSQRVRIDSLRSIGAMKYELQQRMIGIYKSSKEEAISMINSTENKILSAGVSRVLSGMLDEENRLLRERIQTSQMEVKQFQTTFSILMVSTFLILVAIFVLINNSFKSRLLAEEKAQTVNMELEAFTYSVSHDLRAPLRSIRGFTEVMQEEYGEILGKEGNRLLNIVMRNAGRMGQLIDDLLDFSRLGRRTLNYSKIQVRQMVAEIVQELTVHDASNVKWEIEHMDEIRADANMMRQVWTNLISNALKYSKKVERPEIKIGSFPKYGTTVYYVKDNGVGFDMKYSDKLFKVFQRLHNNQEFEGTGVGLALVQRIVAKHNGKIWADAKINEGASFFFYINNHTV